MDKERKHKIFKDLPKSKFHSCIISTFSFDYLFFDLQLRRQLQSREIMNIIVLVDAHQLDEGFGKLTENARRLSQDYTLISVESKACFHPKLCLFVGDNHLALHIGSGNLTSGGMGKNHECFSTLYCDSKDHPLLPVILSGAHYLHSFIQDKKGSVQTQLRWMIEHCALLDAFMPFDNRLDFQEFNNARISLTANGTLGINEQLVSVLNPNQVKRIQVVSPFFDDQLTLITQWLNEFPNANIELYVQRGSINGSADILRDDKIQVCNWDETLRGQVKFKSGNHKFNHSKVFLFHMVDDSVFALHGSPNATVAGMGINPGFRNEEAALLIRYNNTDEIKSLGIYPKVVIPKNELKLHERLPSPESLSKRNIASLKIKGGDKLQYGIQVYFKAAENASLCFLNAHGALVEKIVIDADAKEGIFYYKDYQNLNQAKAVYLDNEAGLKSKLCLLNEVVYLYKCDPKKENRKLQKLLLNIQSGSINAFDILSHLSAIQKETNFKLKDSKSRRSNSTASKEERELTYDESKELLRREKELEPLAEAKEIFDSHEILTIAHKALKFESAVNEEEAGLKSGGGTAVSVSNVKYKNRKSFNSIKAFKSRSKKIAEHFEKYINYLKSKTRLDILGEPTDDIITSSEIALMLVHCNQLIELGGKEFEIVKKPSDDDSKKTTDTTKQVMIPLNGRKYDSTSFYGILYQMIGVFTFYLKRSNYKKYEDEYAKQELMKYQSLLADYLYLSILLLWSLSKSDHKHLLLLFAHVKQLVKAPSDQRLINLEDDFSSSIFDNINIIAAQEVLKSEFEIWRKTLTSVHYFDHKDYGVLEIIKAIPEYQPKSFWLKFPGVALNKENKTFGFPYIYNKPTDKWLKAH